MVLEEPNPTKMKDSDMSREATSIRKVYGTKWNQYGADAFARIPGTTAQRNTNPTLPELTDGAPAIMMT